MAVALAVIFGLGALAVDYGHMAKVKAQLQNAADAGALSGARVLTPYIGSPPQPNWIAAQAKARQTILRNRVGPEALTEADVLKSDYGYLNTATLALQSSGIIPTASHLPAVQVKVEKDVPMMFAPLLGINTYKVSAQATAMISFPKGVPKGALKPMVATKAIVDNYWDKYDPLRPDLPFQFKLGDGSQAEDTMWSTFKVDSDSNDYTKELILNGNPEPIYVGDSVYLQPGARAVDYGPNEMGKFINQTVVLPIVAPDTLVAKTMAPILGFIAFHITGYSQGGKYIEGYFDKSYEITNPQGVGLPNTNVAGMTSNPPKLIN
jgi:Flp pilus assembly protein TadG